MLQVDFKKIFRRDARVGDRGRMTAWPIHHERDWKILVVVFAVCFVLMSAFAWHIYIGDKIAGGFLSETFTPTEASTRTIDLKKLKADILIMETKKAAFQALRIGRPKTIDPSH